MPAAGPEILTFFGLVSQVPGYAEVEMPGLVGGGEGGEGGGVRSEGRGRKSQGRGKGEGSWDGGGWGLMSKSTEVNP